MNQPWVLQSRETTLEVTKWSMAKWKLKILVADLKFITQDSICTLQSSLDRKKRSTREAHMHSLHVMHSKLNKIGKEETQKSFETDKYFDLQLLARSSQCEFLCEFFTYCHPICSKWIGVSRSGTLIYGTWKPIFFLKNFSSRMKPQLLLPKI